MAKWQPPHDIDPECIPICEFLNAQTGVATFESCAGHGKYPLRVWLAVDSMGSLYHLRKALLAHSHFFDHKMFVEHTELHDRLVFLYEAKEAQCQTRSR